MGSTYANRRTAGHRNRKTWPHWPNPIWSHRKCSWVSASHRLWRMPYRPLWPIGWENSSSILTFRAVRTKIRIILIALRFGLRFFENLFVCVLLAAKLSAEYFSEQSFSACIQEKRFLRAKRVFRISSFGTKPKEKHLIETRILWFLLLWLQLWDLIYYNSIIEIIFGSNSEMNWQISDTNVN